MTPLVLESNNAVHDPIIAEVRRNREALYFERQTEAFVLKDEPPKKKSAH